MLTHGSLFSGIGGFDLGFERAGIKTVWQVEIDPYCRRLLARHFPGVEQFSDIRKCGAHNLCRVDVLTGGFPCQPTSLAGKRLAQSDDRWLWPEYARIIRALRPAYAVMENPPGLLSAGMGDVLGDLAACGYDAEWTSILAADLGAPHLRERIWVVAYPVRDGHSGQTSADAAAPDKERNDSPYRREWGAIADSFESGSEDVAHANGSRQPQSEGCQQEQRRRPSDGGQAIPDTVRSGLSERDEQRSRILSRGELIRACAAIGRQQWEIEPSVGRVADGISSRVDRLRGLGNAAIPQITEGIGRRIVEAAK